MLLNEIIEEIKSNTILMTAIGLSSAGIITFWVKDFPKLTYHFIRRKLTTELTITNQNNIFYDFLKWIERNYPNTNFRKLKITNGRWGHNDAVTSIGYGVHYVRFNKKWYIFGLSKDSANQADRDKETLSITAFSMNKNIFNKMIDAVKNMEKDKSKTVIYRYEDSWQYCKDQTKRHLDSIFIEKEKKDIIVKTLEKFIKSEEWYIKNGIPYQLGILLYGPPGTGKTSLIKAISSYLDYPIYYLSAQKMSKIEHAVSTLPEKCIMVIEDIDANALTHSRQDDYKYTGSDISELRPLKAIDEKLLGTPPQGYSFNNNLESAVESLKPQTVEEQLLKSMSSASLSEILNSLDGMFSTHGRILVATTNHIEQLDSALIRPGRIDLKVEIGFVTSEIAKDFITNFFPDSSVLETDEFKNLTVNNNISVAMLQNKILEDKNEHELIEFLNG